MPPRKDRKQSFYFTRIYTFVHMGFQLEKLKEIDYLEDLSIERRISHWVLKNRLGGYGLVQLPQNTVSEVLRS